ncbi:sensor histidine kinase [Spirosoma fluminis]
MKPVRQAQSYYLIQVTDNGIGFEEKDPDRIFQVFQRLHGKGEFAGTGIGLAIGEKVVTNHGEAITVTTQVEKGATFSMYLPYI